MQRWIVIGVVAVLLVLGGGGFAYRTYKQNRPQPIWVPLLLNSDVPAEKRTALATDLKKSLMKPDVLLQVSKDLGLPKILGLPTDEAAANEVAQRMFVDIGEADSPTGKVPSINIGIKGKRKDQELSGKIALRLMQDVWKILGIEQPKKQES